MALYFVSHTDDGWILVVRAANGARAMKLVNGNRCSRIHDAGPEGVIDQTGAVIEEPTPAGTPEPEKGREIEITSLADVGVRRYRNIATGEVRVGRRGD